MLTDYQRITLDHLIFGGDEGIGRGAELEVHAPDGSILLCAPLARHWREDDNGTLWVRPIPPPEDGAHRFSISKARPRGLAMASTTAKAGQVHLTLTGDRSAVIRDAGPGGLDLLDRWDAFYYALLTGDEQAELDALDGTDWYGRFE